MEIKLDPLMLTAADNRAALDAVIEIADNRMRIRQLDDTSLSSTPIRDIITTLYYQYNPETMLSHYSYTHIATEVDTIALHSVYSLLVSLLGLDAVDSLRQQIAEDYVQSQHAMGNSWLEDEELKAVTVVMTAKELYDRPLAINSMMVVAIYLTRWWPEPLNLNKGKA